MPLYEYQCDACSHRFERIQKYSDPPIETCPKCNGTVRKLPSSPAIQFKGTGWYITDYAKKSGPGAGKSDSSSGKSDSSSGKSESSSSDSGSSSSTSSSTPAAKSGGGSDSGSGS